MKIITIPIFSHEYLLSQINALNTTFQEIIPGESIVFDLSSINWVSPLVITPIALYCKKYKCSFTVPAYDQRVCSYLKAINFPSGVDTIDEFQKYKSYLPIGNLTRESGEKMQDHLADQVYKVLPNNVTSRTSILLPIIELINNIFDHSKEENGLIFAQFYPSKGYLDICIVDDGVGLSETYKLIGEKYNSVDALKAAINGRSTKLDEIVAGNIRGSGLRTSIGLTTKGFEGEFVLASGNAIYIKNSSNKGKIYKSEKNLWKGVIAFYRIPTPKDAVDYTRYTY